MSGLDPGCVRLRLALADGRISAVEVSSKRPAVATLLRGRSAAEAERLLPALFAVCGKAQGRAAMQAIAAARGSESTSGRDPEIAAEAMREHLWRWLLDLPPLLGRPAMKDEFAAAVGAIRNDDRETVRRLLADPRVTDLSARLSAVADADELRPKALPMLDAPASLTHWPRFDADFCRQPTWHGEPAETGALARSGRDGGMAARWQARLDEVRAWAERSLPDGGVGWVSASQGATDVGRSLVETARGLLMHEVALDGDRVASYMIVAPTEWNFHPRGSLPGCLMGKTVADRQDAEGKAHRAMAALDPCVRQEIDWL